MARPTAARERRFPVHRGFEFSSDAVFHRLGDPPAKIMAKFSTSEQVEVFIGPQLKVVGMIKDARGNVIRSKGQANQVRLPQVGILPQIGPLLREETEIGEGLSTLRRFSFLLEKEINANPDSAIPS